MNIHWTTSVPQGLGQCTSSALRTLWKIMGENFQQSIVEAAKGTKSPWRILQPPTGTGKTQGTCVYTAMQADLNRDLSETQRPVGILIVTRLREEADKLKETINRIAGSSVAAVDHSGNRATPEALRDSDALIITHEAFLNAKRGLKEHLREPWERRTQWRGGQRLLTIVDEALANVVDESHATTENLAFVIGHIPVAVRVALPEQVAVLEQMHRVVLNYVEIDGSSDNAMTLLWPDGGAPACVDFDPLRTAMSSLRYDRLVYSRDNPSDRTRLAARVDETLKVAQAALDQFAYYAKTGERHSINSAALGMPLDTPGPVVLDATASANFLWDLFEEHHIRPAVPSNARNYGNVTLHLARASGLGKHSMIERIGERWPRVQRAIEAELGPERSVFMCMHKDAEAVTKGYGARFKRFAVGHWGAVDGRNDWQECDAAVILGLPYRPQTWATNMFCALQGSQDDKWLRSPEWKQYTNVRKVMEDRQLAVSVIQAINRICCRRVIDAEGNCPAADIFIVLPQDKTGEAVLDAVRADMPGLNIVPWNFELDGPKVRQPRNGSSHARLISYMADVQPGMLSLSSVQHELHIGKSGLGKLRETLNNVEHETTKALGALGVQYIPGGGRGAKSYLLKKAA
ncbi:hypothetical protein UB31_00495 [Bradyrhizobium sp. LTSP849]|nr:hypothetical protein UB31_00495 [Bradyrhizobium sp. LTSP849]